MEHALQHDKHAESQQPSRHVGPSSELPAPQQLGLQLQQQAGNQAVQQLLRAGMIQAKLAVSEPDDPDEQEAEAAAGQIMRSHAGAGPPASSCSCGDDEENMCDECRSKQAAIARKAIDRSAAHSPSPAVLSQMMRSQGQPLDRVTRSFFEPRFGQDLSGVRIHTDSHAAESAGALRAHAYTLGNDIWFGAGKYAPDSHAGRHLLAHEMAHTMQQQASTPDAPSLLRRSIAGTSHSVTVGRPDDPLEADAEHVADSVMHSPAPAARIRADNAPAIRRAWYGDAASWVGGKLEDAGSATAGAAEWAGGKLEDAGSATVSAVKWAGGKVVSAGEWGIEKTEAAGEWGVDKAKAVGEWGVEKAKGAGKWAVNKVEKSWECMKALGKGASNVISGNISSLADILGIDAPTGADPSTIMTLVAVLKHPCLQMLPGYELVSGAAGILEKAGKFLIGAWSLLLNPQPIIDGIQKAIGKMIAAIPGYVQGVVNKALSTLGSKLREHGEGVWRHLQPKLDYLAKNWWQVIKDTGWQLLWPWPSVGKDLGKVWDHVKSAADNLWHLRFSKAVDDILAVERGVNSILGSLYGWFFIASVLVGAVLGAIFGFGGGAIPGAAAGAAFAGEVGEGLLIATVVIESASILKAVYNLLAQTETKQEKEDDYEQIASSSLTLAITGVMFLLSEIAVKFAQGILEKAANLVRKIGGSDVEDVAGAAAKSAKGEPTEAPKTDAAAEKPPAPDPEAAAKVKAEDLPKLRDEVRNPNKVHAPEDPKLAGRYDAEVEVGDHTYRRNSTDGSWCRFSEPVCGIDIPEIKADVDADIAPKPEELPPEVAAETPEPNSPEATTTDATPEKAPAEAKTTELTPGTPEHKAARWKEYQERGGKWEYDRWGKVYDRNMVRAKLARAAEAEYHKRLGWGELTGNEPGPIVEGVERRFDITDKLARRGVEVKTGKMYLTQEIAWEVLRDKILVEQGWEVEWHFDSEPSGPLRQALKDANVKVTVDTPATVASPAPAVAP